MSLNIITFVAFMAIAMTTYHLLSWAVKQRFDKEIADDMLTQLMLIALAITMPNALATVLLIIGSMLGR